MRSMKKQELTHRLNVPMSSDMNTYLQSLGHQAKAGGGYAIGKAVAIRGMVLACQKLRIDVSGCKDEADVMKVILDKARS